MYDTFNSFGRRNSVYPSTKYLTNGCWIYMVPQFKPESVLMLGFAGGTVAGLIKLLYGEVPITGVDIEPCQEIYGVKPIQVDAKEYVKTCPNFDVVIVDLFTTGSKQDPSNFIFTEEFVDDLAKIGNYIIINTTSEAESDMTYYRRKLNRFGSNTPNRLSNRIYYYGTKDFNHLIIR